MTFGAFLFRSARRISSSRFFGSAIGFGFEYLTSFLPLKKLLDRKEIVTFLHPSPAFESHLLLVPKRSIPTFRELLTKDNEPYFVAAIAAGREILGDQAWPHYSFGVNGGTYQDVAQVHFHLYAEAQHWSPLGDEDPVDCVLETQGLSVCCHPSPLRKTHLVLRSGGNSTSLRSAGLALLDTIDYFPALQASYTVFIEFPDIEDDAVIFHIVSDE
jgi:diadenosine tetraphosphate (Ap4A) HIT family hydrolase